MEDLPATPPPPASAAAAVPAPRATPAPVVRVAKKVQKIFEALAVDGAIQFEVVPARVSTKVVTPGSSDVVTSVIGGYKKSNYEILDRIFHIS